MQLTEENFLLYAAQHYQNNFCISEEEFLKDLEYLKTIRRMVSKLINNEDMNMKLIVNNFIVFYNVFDHKAASKMLEFKVPSEQVGYFNAFLTFLSLPALEPMDKVDLEMFRKLHGEFK